MTSKPMRPIAEIFEDLRRLCREPGFLHAVSSMVHRDFFVTISRDGEVHQDQSHRESQSRLNHNELTLLCGLLVQSDSDDVFSTIGDTEKQVADARKLLEEFHGKLAEPMWKGLQEIREKSGIEETREQFGEFAREAIFYGSDSATTFQYKRFARIRYRNDGDWLLPNKGISIRPIIDIATYIEHRVNAQMSALIAAKKEKNEQPSAGELTNALLVDKKSLIDKFGEKAKRFLELFSTPIKTGNTSYNQPFAFSQRSSNA